MPRYQNITLQATTFETQGTEKIIRFMKNSPYELFGRGVFCMIEDSQNGYNSVKYLCCIIIVNSYQEQEYLYNGKIQLFVRWNEREFCYFK